MYILSLPKHKLSMHQQVFSFLIDDNQQPYSKDTKTRMRNAAMMAAPTMAKTLRITRPYDMSFSHPLGPSGGYSKGLLRFLEHNRRAKSDKFQSQSFVMLSLQGWAQNGISRFGPTTWTWHCCYNDITAISQNIGEKLDFNFTKSG